MEIRGIQLEKELAKYIDHTLLKASATPDQIRRLCQEAREYGFASVCVNSCYAKLVTECLAGTDVKTCCVVGFPLGAMSSAAKAFETKTAVEDGASEIDTVINVGMLKAGELRYVQDDIAAVVDVAKGRAIVKVIIEACLLTDEEKVAACRLAKAAGADFVKTSTGFSTGGATEADVALMRQTVGAETGVKAAGGIRDLDTALKMIQAGATRIGASAGIQIISDAK